MNNDAIDVLNTAQNYMEKLNSAIKRASEYFQNGEYSEGSNLVVHITDGLEWIIQLVTLRRDIYNKDMKANRIVDNVKEIVEAFKNEDYILVGDLLQYEISPIIDEYYEETTNLLNKFK